MDPIKILKRAWHILWSYRALWAFGLILALTAAGSSGGSGNNGAQFNGGSSGTGNQEFQFPLPEDFREAMRQAGQAIEDVFEGGLPALGISQGELNALLWIGVIFVIVMVVTGIAMAVARYVSETAVIRMVDEYETTDTKQTIRDGLRIGWSQTSWRLFLINLIVNIPVFVLIAVMLVAGFTIYRVAVSQNGDLAAATTVSVIGVVVLTIFVVVALSILLRLLRQFFWRVCALENAGVGESLRRGFELVRENWKGVGLMWLVMVGLGIAWAFVSIIAVILTIPIVAVTAIIAALVAAIPGLLLASLFSLALSGYLPWIAAGVFVLPLFFVIAFSPWVLLTAWQQVYTSTVWTLTYREIKALPMGRLEPQTGPVGD